MARPKKITPVEELEINETANDAPDTEEPAAAMGFPESHEEAFAGVLEPANQVLAVIDPEITGMSLAQPEPEANTYANDALQLAAYFGAEIRHLDGAHVTLARGSMICGANLENGLDVCKLGVASFMSPVRD